MIRCRFVRIVVNLSLIVVMMIQPGMTCATANYQESTCVSAPKSDSFKCEGCGRCEVEAANQICGCCGSVNDAGETSCRSGQPERTRDKPELPPTPQTEKPTHSCCGKKAASSDAGEECKQDESDLAGDSLIPNDAARPTLVLQNIKAHNFTTYNFASDASDSQIADSHPVGQRDSGLHVDKQFTSHCNCQAERQLPRNPQPVRSQTEQREQFEARALDFISLSTEDAGRPSFANDRSNASARPHFSQVQLCNWRI